MLLRGSQHSGEATWEQVLHLAEGAKGADSEGYRAEFIELVRKCRELKR
jgi:Ca-activated chloride channel family protein